MTVTVNHAKTNAISDWTQAQLDEQIALGNFAPGTTLANIVLPSDWNDDHTLTGLGTMAEQNANSVAITGGSVNGTTIGATTASTGKFTSVTTPSVTATTTDLTLSAISTGAVNLNTAGGESLKAVDNGTTSGSAYWVVKGASGGFPSFGVDGSSPNIYTTIYSKGTVGTVRFATNITTVQTQISHTASAVNYVQVTGSATGGQPAISAQGSDSSIGLKLAGKGGSSIIFSGNGTTTMFSVDGTASSVNWLAVTGSGATGTSPRFYAQGTDTNISMAFQPKGTGAIDLAAGSSGVNISNGGTVTAITRTALGTSYTSPPTVNISAPTTAGGVQATATVPLQQISPLTLVSGGTGYTVGDTLTISGGTFTVRPTMTVATVSGGVITSITQVNFGVGTVIPSNPMSVTGGTGSGATFSTTAWGISAVFTITNAGSGYIEQPTITFSGGGGSGAAAYAVIGSTTITRGLAAVSTFHLPSGETLRLSESGGTSVVGLNITNGSSNQNTVYMFPYGSATNPNTIIGSKGTGFVGLFTGSNNDSNGIQQFRAAHTASAVNYVQVTGSATGANPVISSQGSDTNIGLRSYSKGAVGLSFWTNGGASRQFQVEHTAGTIVNYATATGSATGVAPAFSVAGSDTNIDLALTPKGTGLVRFGTYVAGALLATGYINIKAADGTTYKVLVST